MKTFLSGKNDGRDNNSYQKQKVKNECAVTDLSGNHCPNNPTRIVERQDELIHLCEPCYQNLVAGSYGANIPHRLVARTLATNQG